MGIEIERKYLVTGEFKHLSAGNTRIRQAYLSVDPERIVRFRITDETAFITIKSAAFADTITRNEWEYQIPFTEAEEMMKICLPGRIDKTRYYVPSGDHTFEVDVFQGKNEGLIIAEIELSSVDEIFEKPEWLGEEVTGNPAYYNSNLIK
jgi:adenylate cyclase